MVRLTHISGSQCGKAFLKLLSTQITWDGDGRQILILWGGATGSAFPTSSPVGGVCGPKDRTVSAARIQCLGLTWSSHDELAMVLAWSWVRAGKQGEACAHLSLSKMTALSCPLPG